MKETDSKSPAECRRRADALIKRYLQDKRGLGRGSEYSPWLEVRNVPSEGLSSRVKGWKSQRVHHLLSWLELSYFYCLEFAGPVIDVREQYPLLPLEETLAIADNCGIKHPFDWKKQMPVVMTTDFLITTSDGLTPTDHARTIKPAMKLGCKRVLEKFEIERQYWQRRNVDWGIVTERDIPKVFAKNVAWIHMAHDPKDLGITGEQIRRIESALRPELLPEDARGRTISLSELCAMHDDRLGLKPGDALTTVRHMLARKVWCVDMHQGVDVGKPLNLRQVCTDLLTASTPSK